MKRRAWWLGWGALAGLVSSWALRSVGNAVVALDPYDEHGLVL